MPQPKFTDAELLAALRQTGGSRVEAARLLGVSSRCVGERAALAKARGLDVPAASGDHRKAIAPTRPQAAVEFPVLPDGKVDIDELIARRRAAYARRTEFAEARKLVQVRVKSDDPIAVCMLGDPHVDDDGTDLGRLQDDIGIIRRTPGMFAACIGDLQNNWVGRLARLYAHQETTASQAWQLVEWFIHELRDDWLFMVQGNHDHWSGSGDPLRWIQRQADVKLTGDHTVRVALRFAGGAEVRIAARHDWPGNSMWNPSHGQLRAASLTHHDHVIVSGHKHTGGYQLVRVPASGLLAHCVQLGSYKVHDDYADALGMPPRMIAPSCTAIIDPMAGELGRVRIEHDLEAAADYLTWLRARRAA